MGTTQDFPALKYKLPDQWHIYSANIITNDIDHMAAKVESVENLKSFWLQDMSGFKLGNMSISLTQECINGALQLMTTTDPLTGLPLIVKMVDANGKQGSGVLEGNFFAFGAYDECLDIGPGDTEYCLIVDDTHPIPWVFGMCVPKGCTTEDVASNVAVVTGGLVNANSSLISCVSTRKPPFNAGAIIVIVVCLIFVTLVMVATLFDLTIQQLETRAVPAEDNCDGNSDDKGTEKDLLLAKAKAPVEVSKVNSIITAFSLHKVLLQILSTKQPPSAIASINGLHVITMFWVALSGVDNFVTSRVFYQDSLSKSLVMEPSLLTAFSFLVGYL